jgi:hypothetical protein
MDFLPAVFENKNVKNAVLKGSSDKIKPIESPISNFIKLAPGDGVRLKLPEKADNS